MGIIGISGYARTLICATWHEHDQKYLYIYCGEFMMSIEPSEH